MRKDTIRLQTCVACRCLILPQLLLLQHLVLLFCVLLLLPVLLPVLLFNCCCIGWIDTCTTLPHLIGPPHTHRTHTHARLTPSHAYLAPAVSSC